MFDKYLMTPRPDVHVHNRIEQKPHDPADAARLYGELEQRATDAVASATVERLGANNELIVVKIEPWGNYADMSYHVRVLFKLNGVLHGVEAKTDEWRQKVGEEVARQLVASVMRSITSKASPL